MVDVLVGVGLLAVAIVVLLGSLSALLVGARTAERRTVETRLARNEIESLVAQPSGPCPPRRTQTIDTTAYTILVDCTVPGPGLVKFTVRVSDPSGSSLTLANERPQLGR